MDGVKGLEALDDAELLAGAGDDPELFGELYRRHVRSLLAWLTSRTGCAQTGADLTAETFAAAFLSRRRYQDRGVPVSAWLFGIARHQLGTYARRQRVERRARAKLAVATIDLSADDIDRVENLADSERLRREVVWALGVIPIAQADAVRLRVVDGLPFASVADRLGISEGAARVRVFRGLATLHERLDPA